MMVAIGKINLSPFLVLSDVSRGGGDEKERACVNARPAPSFLASFLGYLFGLLALTAQATSFDCEKAGIKVEKLVCGNPEISTLDEELSAAYKNALKDGTRAAKDEKEAALLKSQQLDWLKKRNQCEDISCLRENYLQRIAKLNEIESYILVMSKDDKLCNHMLQQFNKDLRKYGERGDAYQEEHEEFKRVPWQPARFSSFINGRVEYTDAQGALFDFNNDGVQDFVVRDKSSLSGIRADLLFMINGEKEKGAGKLVSSELWSAGNRIDLAGRAYYLSPPLEGEVEEFRVLDPFIYRGISYLLMRELFEDIRDHYGYAVISKYGGGQFVDREPLGKMEEVCYFKRIGAKRIFH